MIRKVRFILIVCVLSLIICGCGKEANPVSKSSSDQNSSGHLNRPLTNLPKVKLWLGSVELLAEVAMTSEELQTGMMFRKELNENDAMLFVFQVPHRASFYMKNTFVPLSIAYIDPNGVILEIYDLEPLNEKPVTAINDNIQFVLEVKQGWFKKNNIVPGTVIKTPKGSLLKTFFQH
ncbi:MAG TPA: DUF192 domain-containing protein [Verrucomicrobiota bacterium]|nr:DUF192 domain-containing protein [Verrucomicrobiota bacterium]